MIAADSFGTIVVGREDVNDGCLVISLGRHIGERED
jgi:hypothetical protein